MAITVPPVRGPGDLGHVDDSNTVRQALLDLDAADAAIVQAPGNLLTANQASLEDGNTTGWAVSSGCTIAASTAQAADGTYSLAVTSTGTADMYATASTVPVTAGRLYTAVASIRAAATSNSTQIAVFWLNSGGGTVSAVTSSTSAPSSSAWTEYRVSAVAPAGAVTAQVYFISYAPAAGGQVYYIDRAGIWEGYGGTWAMPGSPIQGLGQRWDESVGRRCFAWDSVNQREQMVYGDTGWRNVSASLLNGWTGNVYIRRVGWTVTLITEALSKTAASADTFLTIPEGFVPSYYHYGIGQDNGGASIGAQQVYTVADCKRSAIPNASVYMIWTYPVTTAWPTSLPGTAAGVIPTGLVMETAELLPAEES